MKVLICLAFVTCTLASQAIISDVVVAPTVEVVPATKTSYEYSADVHTPQYQTHQSVKSNIADVAVAPAIIPAADSIATKIVQYSAPPVITDAFTPIVSAATIAEPILKGAVAQSAIVHPTIVHSAVVHPAVVAFNDATVKTEFIPAPHLAATLVSTSAFAAPIVKTISTEPIVAEKVIAAPLATAIVSPAAAAASTVIAADKVQYHSQDTLGQAAYGHSEALQSHNAIQDVTGSKAGSFSYVAPDGRLLTTDYVADLDGYRVASNAFPVARRKRSLVYTTAPVLPYAYTAGVYAPHITAYQPSFYSAPIVAVKPASASATSTIVNHGDGLSQTHSFQLH